MPLERICQICLSYMYQDKLAGWLRCPSCSFMRKEKTSMISLAEMMGPNKFEDLTPELQANAQEQLRRVNLFRAAYGKPMIVNSGYRTPEHNAEIGGAKNSSHCTCQAIDFRDNDGELKKYIAENPDILEKCDLYMEAPESTPTWVHLQSRAIPSGHRIFKP
jgi:hypothetical protein